MERKRDKLRHSDCNAADGLEYCEKGRSVTWVDGDLDLEDNSTYGELDDTRCAGRKTGPRRSNDTGLVC